MSVKSVSSNGGSIRSSNPNLGGSRRSSTSVTIEVDEEITLQSAQGLNHRALIHEFVKDTRQYPLNREEFLAFSKSYFVEESVQFLVKHHNLVEAPTFPEKQVLSAEMIKSFVADDATTQINVSATTRKTTIQQSSEAKDVESLQLAWVRPRKDVTTMLFQSGIVGDFLDFMTMNVTDQERAHRKSLLKTWHKHF